MDMQGDPIGGNKAATKHTSDPERYDNPVKEGAGPIASDSLAAESARSGGAFGDNRDSNPQSVQGSKSTFANTDTSSARTLPPAPDAQTRDNVWNESGSGEKYPEGAGGQGNFPGSHAGGSYVGGSTSAKQDLQSTSKGDSYDTSGSGGAFSDSGAGGPSADQISSSGQNNSSSTTSSHGGSSSSSGGDGVADKSTTSGPSYASATSGSGSKSSGSEASAPFSASDVSQQYGQGKPKGTNITEGTEEDFKGLSTQDAEIGSENDPGRRAESDFQRQTQQVSGSTAPKHGGQSGESQYSILDNDQEL